MWSEKRKCANLCQDSVHHLAHVLHRLPCDDDEMVRECTFAFEIKHGQIVGVHAAESCHEFFRFKRLPGWWERAEAGREEGVCYERHVDGL